MKAKQTRRGREMAVGGLLVPAPPSCLSPRDRMRLAGRSLPGKQPSATTEDRRHRRVLLASSLSLPLPSTPQSRKPLVVSPRTATTPPPHSPPLPTDSNGQRPALPVRGAVRLCPGRAWGASRRPGRRHLGLEDGLARTAVRDLPQEVHVAALEAPLPRRTCSFVVDLM